MYARIATFESDPAKIDDAINLVRSEVESGDTPEGLEGAKMLMLVNRETGKGLGLTIFESEEAMRRGDEALNAMSPGASERRPRVASAGWSLKGSAGRRVDERREERRLGQGLALTSRAACAPV